MHKIKLVPDQPFYNRCDIAVYDVTGEKEKKRCKITAEYARADVNPLKEQGMDKAGVMAHYRDWVYKIVRQYIADDWECTAGLEETMAIIEEHIDQYF